MKFKFNVFSPIQIIMTHSLPCYVIYFNVFFPNRMINYLRNSISTNIFLHKTTKNEME